MSANRHDDDNDDDNDDGNGNDDDDDMNIRAAAGSELTAARLAVHVPDDLHRLRLPGNFARFSPKLQCSNVVATCKYAIPGEYRINVAELCRTLAGMSYNPKKFAAGTLRSGRATTLIFDRGSSVCVGTTSVNQARIAILRFTTFLLRAKYPVSFCNFKVENIVCRGVAGFMVDINAIHKAYPMETHYENGKFPGMVFRMKQPAIVFIVFVSGYCIVTASRDMRDSETAWTWFYLSILRRFRLSTTSCPTSSEYRMAMLSNSDTAAEDCDALWNAYCAEHEIRQEHGASYVTRSADELTTAITFDHFAGGSVTALHRGLDALSQVFAPAAAIPF